MTSQWARWRGNLLLRMSSNSSFSRSSSCFSVIPIISAKLVLERARLSLRSRCRFSFAREEEVESELLWDEFVRLTFGAGVLCQEDLVGAACCAVIVNNWPPVGVGPGSSLLLRSFAGFRNETACLAFRQRRVAAGVGGAFGLLSTSSGLPSTSGASSLRGRRGLPSTGGAGASVCLLNDTTCLTSPSFASWAGLPLSSNESSRGRSPGFALISGLLSGFKICADAAQGRYQWCSQCDQRDQY